MKKAFAAVFPRGQGTHAASALAELGRLIEFGEQREAADNLTIEMGKNDDNQTTILKLVVNGSEGYTSALEEHFDRTIEMFGGKKLPGRSAAL